MERASERDSAAGPSGTDCLRARARLIAAEATSLRRHEELLDWAVEELGLARPFAEQIYEIAIEEDVEPAYVFELVRCGVGISEQVAGRSDAPSLQPSPPDWIERSPRPDEARREWRLRTSTRRLRSLLEGESSPADALRAFANAPDIEERGY